MDLRAGLIRIENNYVVRAGQRQLKETKTDSDRRLSLDGLTIRMLADFHEQRAAALAPAGAVLAADAFVFSPDPGHTDGGATTLKVYADWMPATDRKAAEQLGADLAALRNAHPATNPKPVEDTTRGRRTELPRAPRPIDEVLDPPSERSSSYLDVIAGLQAAIDTNRLAPGDPTPTVSELAAWYGLVR